MAHEEQNDPVAQSSMYQRRPPNLVASTADLSERDIKENPVVKEEETNDTEVFEEVVVEVARLSKEPKELIIVTTVHPLSRFNPGAPGAHCVHGLVAHLEPPLENHLNHLPRHEYAEVLKGHPCTPSCTVYFRSSFVAS